MLVEILNIVATASSVLLSTALSVFTVSAWLLLL